MRSFSIILFMSALISLVVHSNLELNSWAMDGFMGLLFVSLTILSVCLYGAAYQYGQEEYIPVSKK